MIPNSQFLRIQTETTGRVWLKQCTEGGSDALVLALHGYGEGAELMMSRLEAWTDSGFNVACVEALHPMYLPNRKIGHSWMTSHRREEAIVENLKYLKRVLDGLQEECSFSRLTVLGYSQGAQMAMRVARWMEGSQLIAIGAELPPELLELPLFGKEREVDSVILARGKKDLALDGDTLAKNQKQWEEWGANVTSLELPGAHRWHEDWADLILPYMLR